MKLTTWNNFLGSRLSFSRAFEWNLQRKTTLSVFLTPHCFYIVSSKVVFSMLWFTFPRAFEWNLQRETTSPVFLTPRCFYIVSPKLTVVFSNVMIQFFARFWMKLATWNNFLRLWFSFSRAFEWNLQHETTSSGHGAVFTRFWVRRAMWNNFPTLLFSVSRALEWNVQRETISSAMI